MEANKTVLRKHYSNLRNDIKVNVKKSWDEILCQKLISICEEVDTIHTYLPYRSEPNLEHFIRTMLDRKKTIICPKTLKHGQLEHRVLISLEETEKGLYDTPYPANNEIYKGKLDVIITPGLAFDLQGIRLGYGGGYYDRFLENRTESLLLAPCYPFQLIEKLPIDKFDIPVDKIILSL